MKLTKTEAVILAAALETAMDEINDKAINGLSEKLLDLQTRLENFGVDKRRGANTGSDDFFAHLLRFSYSQTVQRNH